MFWIRWDISFVDNIGKRTPINYLLQQLRLGMEKSEFQNLGCKEITMVTKFSMPNENCNRRWYCKIWIQISLSNNEINIWSVTFWWQIVLWESLESWPSVHQTSVHYDSDNWLSCGLWFQKLWSCNAIYW